MPDSVFSGFGWAARLAAASVGGRGITHYRTDGTARVQTYAELRTEALAVAGGLQRAGLRPGSPVVLQLEASDEFWTGLWACLIGGYTAVPVSRPPVYTRDGSARRKVLAACAAWDEVTVLLAAADRDPFMACAGEAGLKPQVLDFGECGAGAAGVEVEPAADRIALMLFTSGSTGTSKGVPLTEKNLLAMSAGTIAMNGFTAEDVALNWMAADHVGAVVFLGLVPVDAGCAQVQVPTSLILQKPTRWLDLIAEHRASISWAPNFAFSLVLESEAEVRSGSWNLSSMRFLVNAGEPIVARTARRFLEVLETRGLPPDALRPAFGMSETCSGITWSRGFRREDTTDAQQFVSLGPAISGAQMRVVDQTGRELPEGTAGRLQMRGASVFSGYHGRAELNAGVFSEGWFITGDLAYLRDGELYITGREKDVIIVNGANFYAHEIESVAEQVAGVRVSFTAACALREEGSETERLAIFFVPREGEPAVIAKAMRAAVAQQVGVTAHTVVALTADEVPKTEIGKIKRPELRAKFESGAWADRVVLTATADRPGRKKSAVVTVAAGWDRRALQRGISDVWKNVLGLERVGHDETFFELGGHSLLVVQVQTELKMLLGREVSVAELFSHPTINALADYFAGGSVGTAAATPRAAVTAGRSKGVAIIGIGCRFPGADGPAAFWDNLAAGRESIRFFTAADAVAAGVDPALARDPSFVKAAPMIDGVEDFDAEFFKYSAKEARLLDPQQRLFLESCWEAFEDAGYDPLTTPHEVGLYAAAGLNTYLANNLLADPAFLAEENGGRLLTVDSMGGFNLMITNDKDYLTTRVAFKLNLRGPVVNLQSACSSTLLAVHQASRALLDGECAMALAGGVSIKLPQHAGHQYSPGMLNSPDGHCRAYDEGAEGTIFGNGSGVVLLKRVEDALADGDAIYAVVRGSATNNDGAEKVGFTAPSAEGEYRVVRDAIARAGVHAETITYIEGHGTGTRLGDPIEIDAFTRAFREHTGKKQFCAVGSVKTNIGHMQIASGIAGLIKTALAVKHAQLPATLHFERPNAQIDFAASPFFVSAQTQPWRTEGLPRRAGVNSLGIGGSNVHVILEQAPEPTPATVGDGVGPFVLPLSARTPTALVQLTVRYADFLEQNPDAVLADVCHTARVGRARLACRRASVAADRAALVVQLREWAADAAPAPVTRDAGSARLAFLYSGQGAQRVGMGRELAARFPAFRAALEACAAVVDPLLPVPLLTVMWPEAGDNATLLDETRYTQPALFSYSYALGELYRSWGIEPEVCLGHSVGEFVGAVWAGVWSWQDGLTLVATRARLMQDAPGRGAMLAVNAAPEKLVAPMATMAGLVVIAAYNGQEQTVVAGQTDCIEELAATLEATGVKQKRLPVSHAFHSPLMEPAREPFLRAVRKLPPAVPQRELVSNVSGGVERTCFAEPEYWASHLREPVRYAAGVETLVERGLTVFLEVGPQPVLTGMSRRDHGDTDLGWIATARRGADEVTAVLESVGALFDHGIGVDWAALAADLPGRRTHGLPTYPWQRQRYWIEGTDITRRAEGRPRGMAAEPFLGRAVRLPRSRHRVFEMDATPAGMPWVTDHLVHGRMVAPGAQFLGQCLSAGEKIYGGRPLALEELSFSTPLVVSTEQPREAQLVLGPGEQAETWDGEIISFVGDDDEVTTHATARFVGGSAVAAWERVEAAAAAAELSEAGNVTEHFEKMAAMGIALGPVFRWIDGIWQDGVDQAWLSLRTPEEAGAVFGWHPGLLDCALQALVAAMPSISGSWVPFRFRRVTRHRVLGPAGRAWAHARWTSAEAGESVRRGDVTLYDAEGAPCLTVEGFELRSITAAAVQRGAGASLAEALWTTTWEPRVMEAAVPGAWWVVTDQTGASDELVRALRSAGHAVTAGATLPAQLPAGLTGVIDGRGLTQAAQAPEKAWAAAKAWLSRNESGPYVVVVDGSTDEAAAGAVTALGRALEWERPGGLVRTCVVRGPGAVQALVRAMATMATAPGETGFELTGGELRVARLATLPASRFNGYDVRVRAEASYVITGGWGALGLEVAAWLVASGARHLVLNGRTRPTDTAQRRIEGWRAAGVNVVTFPGDLNEPGVANALINTAVAAAPLRGVVHAAGCLRDGLLEDMPLADFATVWQAKAGTARALVAATVEAQLDFCVFFSSMASAWGSAAQSNYAAANGYLDGLAGEVRRAGRPATSVRWGPWDDVGMTSRLGEASRERLQAWGFGGIAPERAREWFGRLFASGFDPVVAPLDPARFREALGGAGPRLFEYITGQVGAAGAKTAWATGMTTWTADERAVEVQRLVRETIARILGLNGGAEVPVGQGLFDLGIDSLSAVDLKNRLQTALAVKLPATLVFDFPTVAAITGFLSEKIAPLAAPVAVEADADDLEALLAKELEAQA